MTTLLEFKHVSKQYSKDTRALSDVNFAVKEGEFLSIIGPSGAGKSTLLRCINRMIDASSGEIMFETDNIMNYKKSELKKLRTQIGMIFQHYNLVNRLSVIENVLHGRLGYKSTMAGILGLYSKEEKKQAYHILNLLGLQEQVHKRCDQLSGGQKQRVGIARALVQNPKLLLCDEPIASLDPNASKTIMEYLRRICSDMGITVIINLHQVDVAMKFSDRIIGVNEGSIVYDGPPSEITNELLRTIYGAELDEYMTEERDTYAG
ncbi:phosphonate ABC transporter ATP-binding protein [Paenibacillus sp. VTT E-133280]|jgi:phosphonate transport system ATP-binding protein|uniref:phosphonate ABC transporter ATP-binding protein n=1 Tax=Paenibacillus TaxID=44249 RepID=UPI000B9FE063|nr:MULTISPECIES: phosphonate ABC transporter ATP-binding protein [unclassified Paenibacillus]MDH6374068.1 phosphonate transport system ATP-binding protein [Paenibacillus sp. PastF-3]OZQ60143.1 phosphonate ABC transporter ATP-binding protein [Paenibacillus sp. VTT E-133280]OZQ79297.1 phosphonate ABC transporter ATP-binding protein [Paenibacillus sp. VTT E-133291]